MRTPLLSSATLLESESVMTAELIPFVCCLCLCAQSQKHDHGRSTTVTTPPATAATCATLRGKGSLSGIQISSLFPVVINGSLYKPITVSHNSSKHIQPMKYNRSPCSEFLDDPQQHAVSAMDDVATRQLCGGGSRASTGVVS